MQDFTGDYRYRQQKAPSKKGSGCPQFPRDDQESSDLPSLVRKTTESNGVHSFLYSVISIQGFG
eukprot:1154313-Pelagomonas_calceolata.AAC.1